MWGGCRSLVEYFADNKTMKSDVARRSFAFACGMTSQFDVAILNIKLKRKMQQGGKNAYRSRTFLGGCWRGKS